MTGPDIALVLLLVVFFIMMAAPLWMPMMMHWENKKKQKQEKIVTPEEFFADCEGDAVKMIDKFLVDYPKRTWGEMFYMQKQVIKEQRRLLDK